MLASRELAEAATELDEATQWYARHGTRIALEFLHSIDAAIDHIRTWPKSARPFTTTPPRSRIDLRSRPIRGFPYSIVYFVDSTTVIIVAYAHERRAPGYWAERLTQ